jgi:hypothetical protein
MREKVKNDDIKLMGKVIVKLKGAKRRELINLFKNMKRRQHNRDGFWQIYEIFLSILLIFCWNRKKIISDSLDEIFILKEGNLEDKEKFKTFISDLESEISLSQIYATKSAMIINSSLITILKKEKPTTIELDDARKFIKNYFTVLAGSYSSSQLKSELTLKKQYSSIKDKNILNILYSEVLNEKENEVKKDNLEPFRRSYESLNAAFGNK